MNATYDRVILEELKEEEFGSLVLPDHLRKEFSESKGKVISVGPDCKYGLKEGDVVIFYRGEGRNYGGKLIISEKHILAIVEE